MEVSVRSQGRRDGARRRADGSRARPEYRPLDNAKVALKLKLPGGDRPWPGRRARRPEAGVYSAPYVAKQPGAYRVLATATAPDGSAVGEREAGWVAQPAADEFARLEPDREFLSTIAAKTKGELVDEQGPRLIRRRPLFPQGPDHRTVDLAAVASSPLLPHRHRLPHGRMGPASGQRTGVSLIEHSPLTTHESHCSRSLSAVLAAAADDRPAVLIVVGAAGSPEYAAQFRQWAEQWKQTAKKAGVELTTIGETKEEGASDRDRLRAFLAEKGGDGQKPLWIVLIGHGTYDGREAKFNLRGPDVTDLQLSEWLTPIKRPVAVLDCTSASAPFLNRLSGPIA